MLNFENPVSIGSRGTIWTALTALALLSTASRLTAAIGLTLVSDIPSPTPLAAIVSFEAKVDGAVIHTPDKPCRAGLTQNFYLAGLRGETEYRARHIISAPSRYEEGPDVLFSTRAAEDFIQRTVLQAPAGEAGILLESPLSAPMMATDLWGNLVWYYPHDITFVTRPDSGGRFFGIVQSDGDPSRQIVREFDLAGVTLRETNAARLNEQLAALGKRPISGFHHEALRLPDGKILVLASAEQILTNTQGPGPVNVLGDTILVMDANLQLVWAWDSFDHLSPLRAALLGERCGNGACPALYLAQTPMTGCPATRCN